MALGALLTALAALLVGVMLFRPGPQGTLEVQTDDPKVPIIVEDEAGGATVIDPQARSEVVLRAGVYRVRLGAGGERLRPSLTRFELGDGGRQVLIVRRVPDHK